MPCVQCCCQCSASARHLCCCTMPNSHDTACISYRSWQLSDRLCFAFIPRVSNPCDAIGKRRCYLPAHRRSHSGAFTCSAVARVVAQQQVASLENQMRCTRFDDWFSAQARRLRQSARAVPLDVQRSVLHKSQVAFDQHHRTIRVRPNDWFSIEARLLRKHRPPFIYRPCSNIESSNHGSTACLFQPMDLTKDVKVSIDVTNNISADVDEFAVPLSSPVRQAKFHQIWPPRVALLNSEALRNVADAKKSHTHATKPKRDRSQKLQRSASRTTAPTHSKRRRSPSVNSDAIESWFRREARRLALTSDQAAEAQSKSRNRAASGLLWVVLSAAGKASTLRDTGSLATEDLVQEGSFGLLTALERWNPDRGVRLSSFAYTCVKYAMRRAIDNSSRAVRLPVHVREKLRRIYTEKYRLKLTTNKTPSLSEIAAAVGIATQEVSRLLQHAQRIWSIDVPLSYPGTCLKDVLEDPRCDSTRAVEGRVMLESLRRLIRDHPCLSDRERAVIMLRYGLESGDCCLAKEVSEQLGISLYKVRVTERSALEKLRRALNGREGDAYQEWLNTL